MIVLSIPVFICTLFVQVTTKSFPEGTLLAHFSARRPFGRSITHNDYQSFATMTSKFLQVKIIIFDGSGQTYPKYPLFLKYIKNNMLQLLLCSIAMENIQIFYRVPVMFIVTCFPAHPDCLHFLPEYCNTIIKQQLCGLYPKLMLSY